MESIVGLFKSCKECWPLLFASNIVGKTKKQVRGIRITEAIIIGLVLAGSNDLRDTKNDKINAIALSQQEGFKEIKSLIKEKDDATNKRLDAFNILVGNINGRVSRLEGTINSWEVHSGN